MKSMSKHHTHTYAHTNMHSHSFFSLSLSLTHTHTSLLWKRGYSEHAPQKVSEQKVLSSHFKVPIPHSPKTPATFPEWHQTSSSTPTDTPTMPTPRDCDQVSPKTWLWFDSLPIIYLGFRLCWCSFFILLTLTPLLLQQACAEWH